MSQAAEIERSVPAVPVASPAEASRLVARAPAVDAVGLEGRAASLATRSIKQDTKRRALELTIRCMDLTTLEGSDTTGKIVAMCAKAVRPNPLDASVPPVAAVCLYPQLVPVAVEQLRGTGVAVASVAGGFPSGQGSLDARLREIADVSAAGAAEIDIVLNRSLFLGGRYAEAFEELVVEGLVDEGDEAGEGDGGGGSEESGGCIEEEGGGAEEEGGEGEAEDDAVGGEELHEEESGEERA